MKLSALFVFCIALISCGVKKSAPNAEASKKNTNIASLKWEDSTIALGKISVNTPYTLTFRVTNTSDVPLVFEKIESTCGCTVLDKRINKPVMPHQTDSIVAHLTVDERVDSLIKKIYIVANTEQEFHILRVTATL